jgi:hypothetical protein
MKYVNEYENIKKLYNDITITYELGEPETVEQNGMLTVIQKDKQTVHITDEQLNAITKKIEDIRNKLIKM